MIKIKSKLKEECLTTHLLSCLFSLYKNDAIFKTMAILCKIII